MMRLTGRLALVALFVLGVCACGQVDPVLMSVSMPECIYNGPHAMRAGNASLSLNLNGMTDSGVSLVSVPEAHTASELTDRLVAADDRWDARPDWVEMVADLRLDGGQGLAGVEEEVRLEAGRYLVICIDYPVGDGEPTARLGGEIDVKESR